MNANKKNYLEHRENELESDFRDQFWQLLPALKTFHIVANLHYHITHSSSTVMSTTFSYVEDNTIFPMETKRMHSSETCKRNFSHGNKAYVQQQRQLE